MDRSARRVTIQSMTVDPDESNAEAFAAVGLIPPVGKEVTLILTTIGRKKIIESVHALFGDEPDLTEIAVNAGLYLLEHVPEFNNNETRSGIDVNATLAFQKAKADELDAAAAAAHEADEDPTFPPAAEAVVPESDNEAATEPPEHAGAGAIATVPPKKSVYEAIAATALASSTGSATPGLRRSSPFTGRTMTTPKAHGPFADTISDAGLAGLLEALLRAGITTLVSLKKHDIADLTASLRRPHVKLGSTYTLSRVDVKSFLELGVKPSAAEAGAAGVVVSGDEDVFSLAASTLGAASSVPPLFSLAAKPAPLAATAPARKVATPSAPAPLSMPAVPRPPIPSAMPAPATTLVSQSAHAITEALETCPRALALLQGVPKSELVLAQLWTIAHAIDYETACSFENMDKSEDSAVDAIDAGIAALCAAGTLSFDETVGSRSTPCASMREVRKKVAEWAARSRVVVPKADLPSEIDAGAMTMQSGLAMLAASSQSFAGDNLKHVEEHGAAEARAVAVHGNAQSKQRLLDLGAKMSSGMSNADKIAAHAQACETDAKVAALLASSHIKRITGALALTPGLVEVAAVAGQVRAAVVRAAKEELRAQEHVRPYAEPEALVKAVQAGRLYDKGSNALSLKPLAGTEKELEYLAQPAVSPKPSGAAAELAVTRNLFAAIPLLQTIFGMAAPWDTTAVKTLANVHTVMAHGLAKHGASTTVLNVLMPLMREYEERVDSFQRSPSAEIPDLASCWAHTKTLAITATFITEARKQMANLDIAPDAQALKAQNDAQSKELKALQERMKKLEAKPGGPTKPPPTPGDGEASKGAAKKEALRLGRELLAKQAGAAGQPAPPAKKLTIAKERDGDLATQL
ncbi:hypothetical protein Ctob_012988 [Chrysochromulina tobinii]|uniref:Uncharacterized protein n=1 Tax=Chrysochromulina tobinii TaxID=1460289 RepID=A0A0M0JSG5_9EUKA|nr:hypothetical protein Ctob_012988 [Chrysochromulina tobinii]|eukprot:KOO29435.1 hypothetical protein Ctob_012988 [Chrysochromulina sp. CCMP291]